MVDRLKYLSQTYIDTLSALFEKYAAEFDKCNKVTDAYKFLDDMAKEAISRKGKEETVWVFVSKGKLDELDGIIMTTDSCNEFAHDFRDKLIPLINDEPMTTGLTDDADDNQVWTMTYFAGYIDILYISAKEDRIKFIDMIWYDLLQEKE